jgi:hypothetical protein
MVGWRPCATLVALVLLQSGDEQGSVRLAQAKVHFGTVRIGPDEQWAYVSKFGYAIGEGTYSLSVRVAGNSDNYADGSLVATDVGHLPAGISLDVILDDDWPAIERTPPCERSRLARRTQNIDLEPTVGTWSITTTGLLYQVMRPHIWYFALSDCYGEMGNTSVLLDFDFRAQQFDGSELSIESRLMPLAEGSALLGFTILLICGGFCALDLRRSAGGLHPVIWMLAAAVITQYVSQIFHIIHLVSYRANGVGYWALDLLAEVLFMMSQVAHATLLIAIAQGYTLLHEKACQIEFSRLVTFATLAAHAALVCFGKLEEGVSARRHHKNDGPAGWIIVMIRVLLFIWFSSAVRSTRERGGCRLREFMAQLQFAGSLYFLAYPVMFLVVQLFAPYYRHPLLQVGLLAMQAAGDTWLACLFLSRGAYYKVSSLSASLLPGGNGGSPVGLNKGD